MEQGHGSGESVACKALEKNMDQITDCFNKLLVAKVEDIQRSLSSFRPHMAESNGLLNPETAQIEISSRAK